MTSKTDANYGRGEATVGQNDTLDPYVNMIKKKVRESIGNESFDIPLLPTAATQVLQLANNPNAGFPDLEKLIKNDQVIATKLIKIANSAFYRGVSEVVSLTGAMSRIGLKALKNLVFSLSLESKIFKIKGYEDILGDIWTHSVACAAISEILAKYSGVNPDSAFVGGLVHDIGKPVLISVISQWETESLKPKKETNEEKKLKAFGTPEQKAALAAKQPDAEKIRKVLKETIIPHVFEEYHANVGSMVAAKWGLPKEIYEMIRFHHSPEKAELANKPTTVVALANTLCHHFGYGHEEAPILLSHEKGFQDLGIKEEKIKKIGTDLPVLVDSILSSMARG